MKFLLLLILMMMFVWPLFVVKKQIMLPSLLLSVLFIFNVLIGYILGVFGLHGFTLITIYFLYVILFFFHWSKVKFKLVKNPLLWITIIFFLLILIIDALLYESWRYAQLGRQLAVWDYDFGLIIWVLIPLIFIPFFCNREFIFQQIIFSLPLLGVLFYLLALNIIDFSAINFSDRMTIEKAADEVLNPITLSRFSALVFIPSFLLFIEKTKGYNRFFLLILMFFAFSFIFISGQRGTILAIAFAILLYFLFANKKIFFRLLPIFMLFGVIIYFAFETNFMGISERFSQFKDVKSLDRVFYYISSWEIFSNNKFFYPEGSLGFFYLTTWDYPHNVILEAMVEYGLIGLILCALIYIIGGIYSILILKSKHSDVTYKIVAMIWISLGVSALVSANIHGNRLFFIFSGLLGIAHYYLKKRELFFIKKIKQKNNL